MPEITQKLGFETGNAVSAIQSMTTALGGLNKKLNAFNKATSQQNSSKVVQGFNQVDKAAKRPRPQWTPRRGR